MMASSVQTMASTGAHVWGTVSKQNGGGCAMFMSDSRNEHKLAKGNDRSLGHTGIANVGELAVTALQGMGVEAGEAHNQARTKVFNM